MDPRTNISHPVNIGQVYEDKRSGDLTKLIYLDEDIALLRDKDGNHRLDTRERLDNKIGSGRFSLAEDEDFDYAGRMGQVRELLDLYRSKDGRLNAHKAEAIDEVLSLLTEETASFEEVPFEELDGIGDKAASNLRSAGYKTVEDVNRASRDALSEIAWVGEKGLDSLEEYVRQV